MRALKPLASMWLLLIGCSSASTTPAPATTSDASDADTTTTDSGAGDSTSDVPLADSGAGDVTPEAETTGDAGGCASAASTQECIFCCRQPDAPNYGGFELYAYEICSACTACSGLSPCGTNTPPPAKKDCVGCLQSILKTSGLPSACSGDAKCKKFAACMQTCPLK